MEVLKGFTVSKGIGLGMAFVLESSVVPAVSALPVALEVKDEGWLRFRAALHKVRSEIQSLSDTPDAEQRAIFETYLLMLSDTAYLSELKTEYQRDPYSIEFVLEKKTQEFADKLRTSGDAYLSERAEDILDVYGRVLYELLGSRRFDYRDIPEGAVIAARSIKPTELGELLKKKPRGVVLEEGGLNSHLAILLRNYGIPAVFAVEGAASRIKNGMNLIIDTEEASVIIDPYEGLMTSFQERLVREKEQKKHILQRRGERTALKDGSPVSLMANIGSVREAELALEEGAEGIGLLRTEFIFMEEAASDKSGALGAESVSEETQFAAYRDVLRIMEGRPVTIRTLDAGGDKIIGMRDASFQKEKNPLLGLRAIRLTLSKPELFKTQLRALYRASPFGNLRIMLPLITHVSQISETQKLIHEVHRELEAEGLPFKKDVPLGIMVETAAAAVIADVLADHAAFFSIGTNDLSQYTLGVDRENPLTAELCSEFHLSVVRLITHTVRSAKRAGIPICVCGELAGREEGLRLLAGLGVRSFSMSARLICEAKEFLSRYTADELADIARKTLSGT